MFNKKLSQKKNDFLKIRFKNVKLKIFTKNNMIFEKTIWPVFLLNLLLFRPIIPPVPSRFTSLVFSPSIDRMLDDKRFTPAGCQAAGFLGTGGSIKEGNK